MTRLRSQYAPDFERLQGDPTALARSIAQRISALRTRIDALAGLRSQNQLLVKQQDELQTNKFKSRIAALTAEIEQSRRLVAQAEETARIARTKLQEEEAKSPTVSSLAVLLEHGRRLGLNNGHCPLCGSPLDEADFERHLLEIDRTVSASSSTLSAAIKNGGEADQLSIQTRRKLATLVSEFDESNKIGSALSSQQATLAERATKLSVELSDSVIGAEIEKGLQQTAAFSNDLSILEAFISIHRLTEVEELLNAAKKRAEAVEKDLSRANRARLRVSEARDAVNRVSTEIIGERLAFLKPSLVEFCDRLRPHPEWAEIDMLLRGDVRPFVSFLVGEDLNPRFVFSSGQRRALGLAFLFSVHLSRPWCHLETLILDDPVQHIDDYRALHMVETLSSMRMLGRDRNSHDRRSRSGGPSLP